VKYGTFVAPGSSLRVDVEAIKFSDAGGTFKAVGTVNGNTALSARLEMAYFNLAQHQPENGGQLDQVLIEHNRARWSILSQSAGGIAT
jgi:hypothetical protein